MSDFQRVVEFLRDVRQGPLQTVNDEITQLAGEYAGLCVQANERLRQCSTFLQQGLRSEAIHLAEESPNLLDLVAALDLPDQNAWSEFCQNNGLPVPPPLQLDRAGQLNEAYAQDQPLEHLLARHRLLALSRAPVRDRLEVMRKIGQVDPGNANWESDIRSFERARLKELPTAFYNAVRTKDDDGIVGLMQEISMQPWQEAPPIDLVTAVTDAYGRVQRANAEAELRELLEPLRDAYAARSLHECQAMIQRWKEVMTAAGVTQLSRDLNDEINPVINFVADQSKREENLRRFRESCKVFAKMLDDDIPDTQLEAGYARLQEFREEIPDMLTHRYLDKKKERQRAVERSHKTRMITIGSIAAAVIVVGLISTWLVLKATAVGETAGKIEAAVKLHTEPALNRAVAMVQDLQRSNPSMLREARVASAVSSLQALQTEHDEDVRTVGRLVEQMNEAKQAAIKVGGNPSATLNEVNVAGTAAQSVLNQVSAAAQKLAWVDSENRLGATVVTLQQSLGGLRDRVAGAVTAEADRISAELSAIPEQINDPVVATDARAKIGALSDRVNALQNLPLLDDQTRAVITTLAQRVVERRTAADSLRSVAEALQNIRQHADSAANLQIALDAFIKRFQDDPRAKDFATAMERMKLAGEVDSWQQLAGAYKDSFAVGTLQAAQQRLDAINAYLTGNPTSPMTGPITHYQTYLKLAAEALGNKGTWQASMGDLLATPLLADLGYMTISDGRRYFTLGDTRRTERKINNQVSISFEALDLQDVSKRKNITIDSPLTVSERPTPAPHTKVVAELAEQIKTISDNWDSFGIDWSEKLAKNNDVDVIVRAILLAQLLKTQQTVTAWTAGLGAGPGDTYDRLLNDLARQEPDQLPWQDPSRIQDGTRRSLKSILEAVPAAATAKQKLADARRLLFKSILLDLHGTGVLLKDEQGNWRVETATSPAGDAIVYTVIPGTSAPSADPALQPAAPPGSMLKVAAYTAGKCAVDPVALRNVPQGSIAYIVRP